MTGTGRTRHETRRRQASWLLLLVFVPMLVLSSLHIHAYQYAVHTECAECVNHHPHAGHVAAATPSLHDCVLCQFLTLTYLAATIVAAVFFLRECIVRRGLRRCQKYVDVSSSASPRAPPFVR